MGLKTFKKLKRYALSAGLVVAVYTAQAQCPVHFKDSGKGCVGDTLSISDTGMFSVSWLRDSKVIKKLVNNVPAKYGTTVAGSKDSTSGLDSAKMNFTSGVWVDKAGNVFATDMNNHRVQEWKPGAKKGITVAGDHNGNADTDAMHLNYPSGLYVDDSDNVYVADYFNNRIQLWRPGAKKGITVAGQSGVSGYDSAHLYFPDAVFVDRHKNVYASDYNRVQKWAPGAKYGVTVAGRKNGMPGHDSTYLFNCTGIFVDTSGNVYVSDGDNNRVTVWPPGSKFGICVAGGKYDTAFGGHDSSRLANPYGVYVDLSGRVFVGDCDNERVQRWDPGAKYGITVAGQRYPNPGGDSAHLRNPNAICLDANLDVYISDASNNRIQKWDQIVPPSYIIADSAGTYSAIVKFKSGCIDTAKGDTVWFCSTAAQVVNRLPNNMVVYPNPNNGMFNVSISTSNINPHVDIRLINVLGRVIDQRTVLKINGKINVTFSFDKIPAGMYLLQVSEGKNMQMGRVEVVR